MDINTTEAEKNKSPTHKVQNENKNKILYINKTTK